jgi:hypothetical protein
MTTEKLRQQIASLETELENAKAMFYRAEGAMTLAKAQLAQLEAEPAKASEDAPKVEKKKG